MQDIWNQIWDLLNNQIFTGVALGSMLTSAVLGIILSLKNTPQKIFHFLIQFFIIRVEINSRHPDYDKFKLWLRQFTRQNLRSYQIGVINESTSINVGSGNHLVFHKFRPLLIQKRTEIYNVYRIIDVVSISTFGFTNKYAKKILKEVEEIHESVCGTNFHNGNTNS